MALIGDEQRRRGDAGQRLSAGNGGQCATAAAAFMAIAATWFL